MILNGRRLICTYHRKPTETIPGEAVSCEWLAVSLSMVGARVVQLYQLRGGMITWVGAVSWMHRVVVVACHVPDDSLLGG